MVCVITPQVGNRGGDPCKTSISLHRPAICTRCPSAADLRVALEF